MRRSRPAAAWALYDFAGSAYATTVATALLPAYFASVVAPQGCVLLGAHVGAVSLWGYAVSLCALLVFAAAPVAGAVAGLGGLRGRFLAVSCLCGGACVLLVALCGPGDVLPALGLFVLAHGAYNVGNAFYDAYLPQIASTAERDRVSSMGYAWGYAGGGLQLALALALIQGRELLGLEAARAVQWGMALAGVWWLGFGATAIRGLPPAPTGGDARPPLPALAAGGFREVWRAAKLTWRVRPLRRFLLAYFIYNDGVQTVIAMATIYGKTELGLSDGVLVFTLLGIQGVAMAGAWGFARLAGRIGTRRALMASLACWALIALLGRHIASARDYLLLGAAVGVALGGSQALSRSLFSKLAPPGEPTVYFGFFSVLAKFSSVLGPLVFAVVAQATGSARPALLTLVFFFAAGLALLAGVRTQEPRA